MNLIEINADYLKTANYALFHNRLPICRTIEIKNVTDLPIEGIDITCTGDFIISTAKEQIKIVNPGETIRVSPFSINLDASKLAALTERVVTSFKLTATSKDEVVGEKICEIELMPYDHWTGTTILPQTIVSFITPNHPAVNSLVVKSAEKLKKLTGSSSFHAYQSGDTNDVRQQIASVFAAIHELGIVYRGLPPSYEEVGQRITMPDQVISSKIGNCIELTLLMASVLEAIGLNCLVIFQQSHAYLGVWLVDSCYSCSVCDDPSFIEKKCSRGIDEMIVLECTHIAQENASFEEAVRRAELNLADHRIFEMFIDVKRSRLERILPLPTRINKNGEWTFETAGIDHNECDIDVKEHDRFDLSRFSTNNKDLTKFDIWERKLLDFSLRNSLLNLSLRRRAIQFISFEVNRVEDHLQDGKEYCILPKPNVEFSFDTSGNLIRSKMYEQLHKLISNDIEHHILHTFVTETETKSILKNIYRAARNTIEETGANSLFLAIGTLRWFETEQSTTPRYAPLLLLPVELIYKKGNYYIRTRDEEISLNITLVEFMRQNYNITINGLNPLPLDESGVDVPLIFAIIRDALKEQKRWDVEEECLLGNFSFSKFLMWNDIHSHRDLLTDNKIIGSLVANRLTWVPESVTEDLKDIDSKIKPSVTALPMSVDSSQMAAVIEGGKGNSFILYGPPGTGKSQTITNLIANALYHDKRVLFVAEKMAALSVVQSRLEKIGLGPFCLELHSNKSTKRHVLEQLEKALKVVHIVSPAEYESYAEKIFAERQELISYMEALHNVDESDGLSLYDCILSLESLPGEPLKDYRFDKAIDTLVKNDGIKGIENLLGGRFETVLKLVGQPSRHPLKGFRVTKEMLSDTMGTSESLKQDASTLSALLNELEKLKGAEPLREKILRDNSPAIFNEDPEELRKQWREAKSKWFIPRYFAKRNFINYLKQFNQFINPNEIGWLLEDLAVYRQRHGKVEKLHDILRKRFGLNFKVDEVPEENAVKERKEAIEQWSNHPSEMRDWLHWVEFSEVLRKSGLGDVVELLESEEAEASTVRDAFLKSFLKYKAESKISRSNNLATFEGMLFDEKVALYRKLTEEFQILTQKELYARLASRIPRVTDNLSSGSEIGLLNRNISNGGRGLSLRDLFDQLPTLLPRLCPCMLMSPMSVAQYVDLTADKFDLVIFDEASQMPTSEAVGAIARGNALIVVGDPKQMPPTSFFNSTNTDAEEASIDDMESILEDCRTLEIPSLQLSWHYRSRHESLIAFSNNEYYEGSLITFPSVDDKISKVKFIPIKGVYDKGGKRCNRAEAEAIVKEIVRRLKNEELRKYSIGVIAFSVMQQSLIEDILQDTLEKDKELQEAATSMYEPIFVKNLENVQGDERDVILFSIGYGPDPTGKVSMNFGPLNNSGGERRLNVAVSRARREMFIFSTLKSSDIDLRRTKARGVEGLKHFLQYAESQILPLTSQGNASHKNSKIAESIAEELRKRGFTVTTNVGRSQFRVDVAVEKEGNPGRYSLGILLDGESYHDTHTTRDREIVQPSMLKSLDWKFMRVWSVDWFNNKERVISRILERLAEKDDIPEEKGTITEFNISEEQEEEKISNAVEYSFYNIDSRKANALSDYDLMRNILEVEQPMTFMYLCRRVNALRDGGRITPTLQRALKVNLFRFFSDESGALWLNKPASRNYQSYRPGTNRDVTEIPEIEMINALTETLIEQVAVKEDDLALIASRKLGFSRRGANVDAAFKRAMSRMKDLDLIETIGENVRLKGNQ